MSRLLVDRDRSRSSTRSRPRAGPRPWRSCLTAARSWWSTTSCSALTTRPDVPPARRPRSVEKQYTLQTAGGPTTLAELFDGRSQLVVYHFMFGPDYEAGCPACSSTEIGREAVHAPDRGRAHDPGGAV